MNIDKFKVGKKYDRRIKLTDEERKHIKKLYKLKMPIRAIARCYKEKCSRRLIQFILFPERDKTLKEICKKEKRHLLYYDRIKHTKAIQSLRKYKRLIINKQIKI